MSEMPEGNCPMQPRSRLRRRSVTKAPAGWASSASCGRFSRNSPRSTASVSACLATSRRMHFLGLGSEDILWFFFGLGDPQTPVPLLHAEIDLPPKHLEIVYSGRHSAEHNQPHERGAQGFQNSIFGGKDHGASRQHLQNHFYLR